MAVDLSIEEMVREAQRRAREVEERAASGDAYPELTVAPPRPAAVPTDPPDFSDDSEEALERALWEARERGESKPEAADEPERKRANVYAGDCHRCGSEVPAGGGWLDGKDTDGRWKVTHKPGECLAEPGYHGPEAKPAPKARRGLVDTSKIPEGIHAHEKEPGAVPDVFRVKTSRHKRKYAERWDPISRKFLYEGVRPFKRGEVTEHTEITDELAKRFGLHFGVCAMCGRNLTDEESVARGIGPVCAKRVKLRSEPF